MIRFSEFYPFCKFLFISAELFNCQAMVQDMEEGTLSGVCCTEEDCPIVKHSRTLQGMESAKSTPNRPITEICPKCQGKGKIFIHVTGTGRNKYFKCLQCNGTGKLS